MNKTEIIWTLRPFLDHADDCGNSTIDFACDCGLDAALKKIRDSRTEEWRDIRIRISGPGGCIHTYMDAIEELLTKNNIKVDVVNAHPHETKDERGMPKDWTVKLEADHMPWGG